MSTTATTTSTPERRALTKWVRTTLGEWVVDNIRAQGSTISEVVEDLTPDVLDVEATLMAAEAAGLLRGERDEDGAKVWLRVTRPRA